MNKLESLNINKLEILEQLAVPNISAGLKNVLQKSLNEVDRKLNKLMKKELNQELITPYDTELSQFNPEVSELKRQISWRSDRLSNIEIYKKNYNCLEKRLYNTTKKHWERINDVIPIYLKDAEVISLEIGDIKKRLGELEKCGDGRDEVDYLTERLKKLEYHQLMTKLPHVELNLILGHVLPHLNHFGNSYFVSKDWYQLAKKVRIQEINRGNGRFFKLSGNLYGFRNPTPREEVKWLVRQKDVDLQHADLSEGGFCKPKNFNNKSLQLITDKFKNIKYLQLSGDITNLVFLVDLKALETLIIRDFKELAKDSLEHLQDLNALKKIDISYTAPFDSLQPLPKNLQKLVMRGCGYFFNKEALACLKDFKNLEIIVNSCDEMLTREMVPKNVILTKHWAD